jgi:hypothetical protein
MRLIAGVQVEIIFHSMGLAAVWAEAEPTEKHAIVVTAIMISSSFFMDKSSFQHR